MHPHAPRVGLALALGLAALASAGLAPPAHAQGDARGRSVAATIARLTPRQRVGQLCVVPFGGSGAGDGTAIAALIDEWAIGGVLLDPARGNFRSAADTPRQVATLSGALQQRAADSAAGLPLIVAVDGRSGPHALGPLSAGFTPIPREMALGATWQPSHALALGAVAGRELAAVGVNLLLGPSLDVAGDPRPGSASDVGTRTFGGHPAWVGRFGSAFIEGVHDGGAGRVAVAAVNFPGAGGADPGQGDELPIVERALDDLLSRELAPFLRATDRAASGDATTDALVATHFRYRGIQQQIDRPLALDSGGLRYLWAQVPALEAWRRDGGVVVSPGLGLPAIRRYVDPELLDFSLRRVLREALLADNDLLLLTGLGDGTDPAAEAAAILEGLEWLAAAYEEDESVREAVDASLHRVLALKAALAPGGAAGAVPDAAQAAERTGRGLDAVAAAPRDGLTQLAPAAAGPSAAPAAPPLPSPQRGDRLLFVVDARPVQECSDCPPSLQPDPARFVDAALRTYGPEGSGTARIERIEDVGAIRFAELRAWLASSGRLTEEDNPAAVPALPPERAAEVAGAIEGADWLVFAMGDIRPSAPASDALRLFLRTRRPDATTPLLVAIGWGAPYDLDATGIAKLSAYYAAFSPLDPYVDVAVRAVFGDQPAPGFSPVSVPGANYDLARRLAPDPTQAVALQLVGQDPDRPLRLGQSATVRTAPVYDANGHLAPDGTQAAFRTYVRAEDVFLRDVTVGTVDGIASAPIPTDRAGELEVSAVFPSGLATQPLVVTVAGEPALAGAAGAALAVIPRPIPAAPIDWSILLLTLTLVLLGAVLAYGAEGAHGPSRMLRRALFSIAWGLGGYLLVVVGGLRLGQLSGDRLWAPGWNAAYQAPAAAFALALLPAAWAYARALRRR
jgi:beta-N-acetylhexosaminidase